jgi:hypothetical protein
MATARRTNSTEMKYANTLPNVVTVRPVAAGGFVFAAGAGQFALPEKYKGCVMLDSTVSGMTALTVAVSLSMSAAETDTGF